MVCEDTPDVGANANVGGYLWNNENIYKTMINISCEAGLTKIFVFLNNVNFVYLIGRAFDTLYVDKIVNQCDKHDAASSNVTWKYNANNPLPACIRELDFDDLMNVFYCFPCSILCEHKSARST